MAISAAVSCILHLPGLLHGPTLDGAVFTEVADRVLHGGAPYADVWDHKPPGMYWTLAAARAVAPGIDPWRVTWVASVAATTVLALVAGLLSNSPIQRAVTVLVTVIYAAAYPIALGGGQTETPAAILVTAALVLSLRKGLSPRRACLTGVLTCSALIYSFEVLPLVLVTATLVVSSASGWANRARAALAGLSGAFSVGAAAVLAVVVSGATQAAWSALVTYNVAYNALNRSQSFDWGPSVLLLLVLLPLLAAAAVGAVVTLRATPRVGRALVGCTVVGVAYIAWQARLEPHYAIPMVPPLAALASSGVDGVRRIPMKHIKLTACVGMAALAAIGIWVAIPWSTQLEAVWTDSPVQGSAVSWLRDHSSPGDAAFVWGNEPSLYYEAQIAPTSKFVYVLPVLTPGYVTAADVAQMVADVRRPQARWVIDAGSPAPGLPGLVPLLVSRPVAAGDGRVADIIGPLREVISAEYREAAIVGGWIIYERRP